MYLIQKGVYFLPCILEELKYQVVGSNIQLHGNNIDTKGTDNDVMVLDLVAQKRPFLFYHVGSWWFYLKTLTHMVYMYEVSG